MPVIGYRDKPAAVSVAGAGTPGHAMPAAERDITCCYARQDKFWVTGAPGGERWEIYTVLADSATFWGQDGEQRWDAVEAELDAPAGQATQCCGGPQAASGTGDAATGVCCA